MNTTKKFSSFDEYEAWTEKFESPADYQEIPTIIDDGWKVAMDLFSECKSYKTAIRRFVKAYSDGCGDVKDWGEGMLESCGNGYWKDSSTGYQDAAEERRIAQDFGSFSWGVEETSDGLWYIFLNVSGGYAGRGARQ